MPVSESVLNFIEGYLKTQSGWILQLDEQVLDLYYDLYEEINSITNTSCTQCTIEVVEVTEVFYFLKNFVELNYLLIIHEISVLQSKALITPICIIWLLQIINKVYTTTSRMISPSVRCLPPIQEGLRALVNLN